jgi:hypothetical protein
VFVHERGSHTSLAPLYAYSPRGKRVFFKVPQNRGKQHHPFGKHDDRGDRPFDGRRGLCGQESFEAYVERFLVPALKAAADSTLGLPTSPQGARARELNEHGAMN